MEAANQDPQVRRVQLPSGKTIEVVYFGEAKRYLDATGGDQAASPETQTVRPLHVCDECDSDFVYPTNWEEAGPEQWRVHLRCPNCEWRVEGVFDQAAVEVFDEQLDVGTEALVRDCKRLMHANMAEEIDRFVTALEADAILPEDF